MNMPPNYAPDKVVRRETAHKYGEDAELRILRLARSFIQQGWCQDTCRLGVTALGPVVEREYSVVTPYSYSISRGVGSICHPAAEDATRWTIQGAFDRALYSLDIPEFGPTGLSLPFFNIHMAIGATSPQVSECYGFEKWNNIAGRTQEEVLQLFDRAIYHFEQLTTR